MRHKVDVVKRHITDMGLGCRVYAVNAWVGEKCCRDVLKSCDIIFGCTDDNDGRLLLNRVAYYYLIPIFDLGLAIDVSTDVPPHVLCLDGRVTYIYPEKTCLMCREIIDMNAATVEGDHLASKRVQIETVHTAHVERHLIGGRTRVGIHMNAAMAAEPVLGRMGAELIERQIVFTRLEGEIPRRHLMVDHALLGAERTIA